MRRVAALALLLCVGTRAGALAQGSRECPLPGFTSKEALRTALGALHEARSPELQAALMAGLGQPVVGWALEIAADSSGTTTAAVRSAALVVLRYARWKPAVATLVRLAEPLRGDWIVWSSALTALASYPYPELEPYWTDMVVFPRRVVRETALRGLALVGTPRSMLAVRASTHKETDPATLALVAQVEAQLQRPLAARDTALFAWPPDSLGGRFTPSAAWRRAHPGCL